MSGSGAVVVIILAGITFVLWALGKIAELAGEAQRKAEQAKRQPGRRGGQDTLDRTLREAAQERARAQQRARPSSARPAARPAPAPAAPRRVEQQAAPSSHEDPGKLESHRLGSMASAHVGAEMRARHIDSVTSDVQSRRLATSVGLQAFSAEALGITSRGRSTFARLDTLAPLPRAFALAEVLGKPVTLRPRGRGPRAR